MTLIQYICDVHFLWASTYPASFNAHKKRPFPHFQLLLPPSSFLPSFLPMGQWQPHRLSRHWGHWPLVCPSVAILLFLAQLARSAPIDLVSYSGHTRPVQWGGRTNSNRVAAAETSHLCRSYSSFPGAPGSDHALGSFFVTFISVDITSAFPLL